MDERLDGRAGGARGAGRDAAAAQGGDRRERTQLGAVASANLDPAVALEELWWLARLTRTSSRTLSTGRSVTPGRARGEQPARGAGGARKSPLRRARRGVRGPGVFVPGRAAAGGVAAADGDARVGRGAVGGHVPHARGHRRERARGGVRRRGDGARKRPRRGPRGGGAGLSRRRRAKRDEQNAPALLRARRRGERGRRAAPRRPDRPDRVAGRDGRAESRREDFTRRPDPEESAVPRVRESAQLGRAVGRASRSARGVGKFTHRRAQRRRPLVFVPAGGAPFRLRGRRSCGGGHPRRRAGGGVLRWVLAPVGAALSDASRMGPDAYARPGCETAAVATLEALRGVAQRHRAVARADVRFLRARVRFAVDSAARRRGVREDVQAGAEADGGDRRRAGVLLGARALGDALPALPSGRRDVPPERQGHGRERGGRREGSEGGAREGGVRGGEGAA